MSGELTDEDYERAVSAYWAHLAQIRHDLPPRARDFIDRHLSLHDGLTVAASVDREHGTFTWVVHCGNLQTGYFEVTLRYSGIVDLAATFPLETMLGTRGTMVLYDELAADGELFEHSIIFESGGELTVRCRGFDFDVEPVNHDHPLPE